MNLLRLVTGGLLLLFGLLSTGCGPTGTPAAQAPANPPAASIQIERIWSRSTPELMGGSGIVYMVIKNNGDQLDRLVASKTPVSKFSELHETSVDESGVMRMRGVKGGSIEVPARGEVALEPAGLHVMLIDLTEPLQTGATFPLTLKFEQAGEVTIQVPVLDGPPAE